MINKDSILTKEEKDMLSTHVKTKNKFNVNDNKIFLFMSFCIALFIAFLSTYIYLDGVDPDILLHDDFIFFYLVSPFVFIACGSMLSEKIFNYDTSEEAGSFLVVVMVIGYAFMAINYGFRTISSSDNLLGKEIYVKPEMFDAIFSSKEKDYMILAEKLKSTNTPYTYGTLKILFYEVEKENDFEKNEAKEEQNAIFNKYNR